MFGIVLSSMCSKSQIIAYTYILCNIATMEKFKDKYTIFEKKDNNFMRQWKLLNKHDILNYLVKKVDNLGELK